MSRESSLAKNTLIISLGTFLPKFTSIITLPVITAGLTKAELGTYDLVSTLVSLILPLVTLQIQSAAFRFLIDCRNDTKETNSIISNILIFTLITSLFVLPVIFFSLANIELSTRLFICFFFFADIFMLTLMQIVRGLSFNKIYSASSIIRAVINMLLVVYTLSFKSYGLNGVLFSVSFAACSSIFFLVVKANLLQRFNLRYFDVKQIKSMLAYSWPMVPNSLSLWALSFSDRAVLTFFIGIEANALYAVANKIPMLFTTVQGTFIWAWQENASLALRDNDVDNYYSRMFEGVFRILCGVMAVLISFTPILFRLLIRGDYSEAYKQMPILFMGLLFSAGSSFIGGIYVAHKRTKNVGITTVIAALINLTVDLLLVKSIGIFAASISTLTAYLFLFVFRLFDVQKFQPMKYNFHNMIIYLCALILMCVLCSLNRPAVNLLNAASGIIFAFTLNKKIIKDMYIIICKKFKKKNK